MIGQLQNFTDPYNQFSEHDEKILTDLVNRVTHGTLCEIGCWTGHSTTIIANHAKSIGQKLVVIDNFKGNKDTCLVDYAKDKSVKDIFINNMKNEGVWDSIVLFSMDSDEAYKYFINEFFSFIFVDGGHTYTQVDNDLMNYIPKVKKGSIFSGHDYESETYDENHINEDYVNGRHNGVIKAVNKNFGIVNFEGRMWWKQL